MRRLLNRDWHVVVVRVVNANALNWTTPNHILINAGNGASFLATGVLEECDELGASRASFCALPSRDVWLRGCAALVVQA